MNAERGAATRQRLLDAATAVFVQRGYARATTKEIARTAGVAEGTIYRHFSDKQELFHAAFSEKSAITAEEFLRLPELAGRETIRENLHRFISVIEDAERIIGPLQASMWADTELMQSLAAPGPLAGAGVGQVAAPLMPLATYLRAEQELGRIRADVDCDRAAFALFAIPFASVILSRISRTEAPAVDLDIMGVLDIVLDGLLP